MDDLDLMFSAGGVCGPYRPDTPPTVLPRISPVVVEPAAAACPPLELPPAHRVPDSVVTRDVGVILLRRQATGRGRAWLEVMVEHFPVSKEYGFPSALIAHHAPVEDAVHAVLRQLSRRHIVSAEAAFTVSTVVTAEGVEHAVVMLDVRDTQRNEVTRVLSAPPKYCWAAASEFMFHDQVGMMNVFGLPISMNSLRAFAALPPHLQKLPGLLQPMVLYHGTARDAVQDIAHHGLLPSAKPKMLGRGIYLARFDKACEFARHDADNAPRAEMGCVLKCYVFVPLSAIRTMTSADVCTCGCAKPYVDHPSRINAQCLYVPDYSPPAVLRAEWCVRDQDAIVVEGAYVPSTQPSQTHSRHEGPREAHRPFPRGRGGRHSTRPN